MYGLTAPFVAVFTVLQGSLAGAGQTRLPFLARVSGMGLFTLGVTYGVGVGLGYGIVGAYLGVVLSYVWMASVVAGGFRAGEWAQQAASMLEERGSIPAE